MSENIIFYTLMDKSKSRDDFQNNTKNMNLERLQSFFPDAKFPCILLVRNDSWNDYSYRSNFIAIFFN
jgi:hypothetical protein